MTIVYPFQGKSLLSNYKVVELFQNSEYEPVPDSIRLLDEFIPLDDGTVICPVFSSWPQNIQGTGLNFLHVGKSNICNDEIKAFRHLDFYPSKGQGLPTYRCKAKDDQNRTALLFSVDAALTSGNTVPPLTLQKLISASDRSISDRKAAVENVAHMLLAWFSAFPKKEKTFIAGEYLSIPDTQLSPVPVFSKNLAFNFDELINFPNPIVGIKANSGRTFSSWAGIQNGELVARKIYMLEKPVAIGWQRCAIEDSIWGDFAYLELDLLLTLLEPFDTAIWKREWKYIRDVFSNTSFVQPETRGTLLQSAVNVVSPIRQLFYNLTSGQQVEAYYYAAIKAGINLAFNNYRTGPERLAALLYASAAWDAITPTSTVFETEIPTTLFWPGYRSWRVSKANEGLLDEKKIGSLLVIGTGVFGVDSKVPQIPSVQIDLNELADFFRNIGYTIHSLIGSEFKRNLLEKMLNDLNQSEKKEPLWVVFCGHGLVKKENYWLLTYDSALDDLENTSIDFDWLANQLVKLDFKYTILVLNSCYSGQPLSAPITTNNNYGGTIIYISSASPGEKSYSLRDDPFSIFVGTFLEGIRILENSKGEVSIFDFLDFITTQVPIKATRISQQQHPVFYISNLSENFSIKKSD